MKTIYGFLITSFLMVTCGWGQPLTERQTARIDQLADSYVKSGKTPGVAVGIIHAGKIVFSKGYGLANLEHNIPVTAETVFRITSVTKQLTATGILLLAERGLLKTDDKLAGFFPEIPRSGEITIKQLLTHTAGFSNYSGKPDVPLYESQPHSIAQLIEWIRSDALAAEPGTAWIYSNSGYLILAGIIEKASNQPYAEFMRKNIFEKLGLAQTAIEDKRLIVPHRAAGYTPVAGKAGTFTNASVPAAGFTGGGTSAISTVGDLLRWHDALFHGRILRPSSFAEMTKPAVLGDGKPVVTQILPESNYGYGLLLADIKGHRKIGHTGTNSGFNSMLFTYPADEYTVAVLVNSGGKAQVAAEVENAVARIVLEVRRD